MIGMSKGKMALNFTLILLSSLLCAVLALPGLSPPRDLISFLRGRDVCFQDDTLDSFEYWLEDAAPYCSSLLGISDYTVTLQPATSRT